MLFLTIRIPTTVTQAQSGPLGLQPLSYTTLSHSLIPSPMTRILFILLTVFLMDILICKEIW